MGKNNKKFWSLFFGCILANSYVWLADIGMNATVPQSFQSYTDFVINYYAMIVTAATAIGVALLVILVMDKGFDVCVSDHLGWLLLPSMSFIAFTALTAQLLISQILAAAIPALLLLSFVTLVKKRDHFLPDRSKVW